PPIIFVSYESCTGSVSCNADIREYVSPVDNLILSETSNSVNIPTPILGLSVVSDKLTSVPNFHLSDAALGGSGRSTDAIGASFQPVEAFFSSAVVGETRDGKIEPFSSTPLTDLVLSEFKLIAALSSNP